MSLSTIQQKEKFSEISEESMSTIKNIVNCLPKTHRSRNDRNNFLFREELSQNSSIEQNNVFSKENHLKSGNKFYMDSFSNNSSCSSSCSGKMENISKCFGKQNLNYSNVKYKSKFNFLI